MHLLLLSKLRSTLRFANVSKELLMPTLFEAAMPIVMALRNPDLNYSHWADIRELIGTDLNIYEETFTLQSLLDMNVVQFME